MPLTLYLILYQMEGKGLVDVMPIHNAIVVCQSELHSMLIAFQVCKINFFLTKNLIILWYVHMSWLVVMFYDVSCTSTAWADTRPFPCVWYKEGPGARLHHLYIMIYVLERACTSVIDSYYSWYQFLAGREFVLNDRHNDMDRGGSIQERFCIKYIASYCSV